MYFQQGDVLIKQIDQVPQKAEAVQCDIQGRLILAHGEVTGHSHTVEAGVRVRLYTLDEILFLEVESRVTVVHPEHRPIALPPGHYRIEQVREFDYLSHEGRAVRD